MLAETELLTLLPQSPGKRVALPAEIVLLEPEMPVTPLRQSMFCHARRDRDPGHAWLRDPVRPYPARSRAPVPALTGFCSLRS